MLVLLFAAAVIAIAVGIYAHTRPPEGAPTVQQALNMAKCRPLKPWPWREWLYFTCKPDERFLDRQRVWEHFERGAKAVPVILKWYTGTRLHVQLGNELSRSLFVIGAFDANEFAFLDRYLKPGMVFVDAGANEGLYTVFAAQRTGPHGRVFAIEPSARERAICEANLKLNCLKATVLPCAVGESDTEAELLIAQGHRAGHNTLGAFAWDDVQTVSREIVPLRSLDSLAAEHKWERLDVIKMDIEGAEMRALRGGTHVFRDLRPVVIVEVSPRSLEAQGSRREELLAAFEDFGYAIYHFDPETGLPTRGDDIESGENLMAFPKELASPAGFEPALSP